MAGLVWGGVAAALALAALSLLSPVPGQLTTAPQPAASQATKVAVAEAQPDVQPAPAKAPEPPAAPATESEKVAPVAPASEATLPDATAPAAPATTQAPVAPAPVLPLAPKAADGDAPATLATPQAASDAPAVAGAVDPAPQAPAQPGGLPTAPAAEPQPGPSELPPAKAPEPKEDLLTPTPAPETNPSPAMIELDPAPETPAAPLPGTAAESSDQSGTASTLAPDGGLKPAVEGVKEDALPQIGVAPPETQATAPEADTRPIVRFARSFERDGDKPAFAIVLRDTGAADVDRARLAALPFPISFVIDPAAPNAREAAAIYRAAGQEVVMLATGIPTGASAADLEQTFQANAAILPEAVAVMDLGATGGFQDNRLLASLVVPVIGAQGRGVLTFDQGLNAADQVARRNGVPAAVIFRDLDADNEDASKIRRYLDRAAFKAAQEGQVVVVGRTLPETIAALLEWSVEGRSSSVSLAPLTAVLQVN